MSTGGNKNEEENFFFDASLTQEDLRSQLEYLRDNYYDNYLEGKKKRYGFDFEKDESPAILLNPKKFTWKKEEEKENIQVDEERELFSNFVPVFARKGTKLTKRLKLAMESLDDF